MNQQQGYGNPNQQHGKPNNNNFNNAPMAHPANPRGGGKEFTWSFLCCCGRQAHPAGRFLSKTFMTHIIVFIISLVAQIGNFIKPPEAEGNNREGGNVGPAIVNIVIYLILIALNFLSMGKAKNSEYSGLLNLTTILNCIIDVLSAIAYFLLGALLFIIVGFINGLNKDGWSDETKSKVNTFVLIMWIFIIIFFLLGAIFVSLIAQACTSCDAAKDLEQNGGSGHA